MDAPSRFLGRRHRIIGHGPFTLVFNTLRYGIGGGLATILHVLTDFISWFLKRLVRL